MAEALLDYCPDVLGGQLPPDGLISRPARSRIRDEARQKWTPTYSKLYTNYLEGNIAALLIEHEFQLVARPERADTVQDFTFRRGPVGVTIKVRPDTICGARIDAFSDGSRITNVIALERLLRLRRCSTYAFDRAFTKISMSNSIFDALVDYCPDVLSGQLPPELAEMLERSKHDEPKPDWKPPTTPARVGGDRKVLQSAGVMQGAEPAVRPKKTTRRKRGRSKSAGDGT